MFHNRQREPREVTIDSESLRAPYTSPVPEVRPQQRSEGDEVRTAGGKPSYRRATDGRWIGEQTIRRRAPRNCVEERPRHIATYGAPRIVRSGGTDTPKRRSRRPIKFTCTLPEHEMS